MQQWSFPIELDASARPAQFFVIADDAIWLSLPEFGLYRWNGAEWQVRSYRGCAVAIWHGGPNLGCHPTAILDFAPEGARRCAGLTDAPRRC